MSDAELRTRLTAIIDEHSRDQTELPAILKDGQQSDLLAARHGPFTCLVL